MSARTGEPIWALDREIVLSRVFDAPRDLVFGVWTEREHISKWLSDVLAEAAKPEWPRGMHEGMRENLSHYRDLVRYLISKQKESKMNARILEQLKLADDKNDLPAWIDAENLRKSADELQPCLESVLRGKLLIHVKDILKKNDVDFYRIYNAKEQSLVYHGMTYYKGLKPQEVSVLSWDIESSTLRHKPESKVLMI